MLIGNNCVKFEQNTFNGMISAEFTRLYPLSCIVTLNFDLQNQYGSSSHSAKFHEDVHICL